MDKTRTLPPQVRGRVTGVLNFFVDEIRLFRNILLLTNNFDLVLQVQWWGEVLPVFIRPRDVKVPDKTNTNSHLLKTYYHSAKYDIKTTLDLFKSYLRNIEVLELSVLEAFENYIIGSAFLKDLIKLLNKNNELIRMPIFDYLGEEIGEVVIHVNFLQKPKEENKKNLFKCTHSLQKSTVSDILECSVSNIINSDIFTLTDKTILYDGSAKRKVEVVDYIEPKSSTKFLDFGKSEKTMNFNVSSSDLSKSLFNERDSNFSNKSECGAKDTTCQCLPEVEIVKDSSKVLHFGVSSKQTKQKTAGKQNQIITNKFNSNAIKCKSKSFNEEKLNCKKLTNENTGNMTHSSASPKKEKQFKPKYPSKSNVTNSEIEEFRNISEDSPNSKVLNYLLGSDMSKNEEESALSDFRKMSPSHNLVDSINQLCLVSNHDLPKSVNRSNVSSTAPSKETQLKFDFTNPIERSYYERFFLKTDSSGDFEIAEFLNKPPKDFARDKVIESRKSELEINNLKTVKKFPTAEVRETSEKEFSVNERRNSCARCKYYKKLDELDTIIESLKNFEQKMLFSKNDLQSAMKLNSDMLNKT